MKRKLRKIASEQIVVLKKLQEILTENFEDTLLVFANMQESGTKVRYRFYSQFWREEDEIFCLEFFCRTLATITLWDACDAFESSEDTLLKLSYQKDAEIYHKTGIHMSQ